MVTLGERGAFALADTGERIYSPGYNIKLVDPCGSGDGFAAAFVHSLLDSRPLVDACRLGNALGAMVAQQDGATRSISSDEVMEFMNTKKPDVLDDRFTEFMK